MLVRYLLLVTVAVLLLALRAPIRYGEGGFAGKGIIWEQLGELGAAGKWIQSLLRDQLVGKRVHYMKREHSWSGKVMAVEVQPFTEPTDNPRSIKVTVATIAGMGDQITETEFPRQEDYGSKAIISLDQISGIMQEGHRLLGNSIKVTIPDDVVHPQIVPSTPVEMFIRGNPNTIVAYYSDGYLEVDVNSLGDIGSSNSATFSGTIFIHVEDIITDPNLDIVSSTDLENTRE